MIVRQALGKQAKNVDRIRDELQVQSITLIDKPGGVTIWNLN